MNLNPSAIYSKSGKGVQEATGKTSFLRRNERAVLSAIDGRASLGEVAKKVGKPFDAAFMTLISQLDREDYIHEVTTGSTVQAPAPAARSATPPPAQGGIADLDFTQLLAPSGGKPADSTQRAKEQESALYKARQEAEERAQRERERVRAEAEARARAEAEARFREETEKKLRDEVKARAKAEAKAEAEAKAKAAREEAMRLAAEAKAKAEAEAQAKIEAERKAREEAERKLREEAERRARDEAERARKEAEAAAQAKIEAERKAREETERKLREEAERKAREEAERARREAETAMQAKLEAERQAAEEERKAREQELKAREEAERKAREEAEKAKREAEELRQRLEEEKRLREEEERRRKEEEARRALEEQQAALRRAREEQDRRRKKQEEEAQEEKEAKKKARKRKPEPEEEEGSHAPQQPIAAARDKVDELLADIESFSRVQEEEAKKRRAEADRLAAEEAARKEREEEEERNRKAREEEERLAREEEARRKAEEEERARRQAEEEERARREAEEQARREAEEQERVRREAEERKAREEAEAAAREAPIPGGEDIGVRVEDLNLDDVRRDQAVLGKESRKARRQREREARRRKREARRAAKAASKPQPVRARPAKRSRRPLAVTLALLLAAGVAALHVVPLPTASLEQAVAEAIGQPVRIGTARISLYSGVRYNLEDVSIGKGSPIASVQAYPTLGSLFGESQEFSRVEVDGLRLSQEALADLLFARLSGPRFRVTRLEIKNLALEGPVSLPVLDAEAVFGTNGALRSATIRGPEGLYGRLAPAGERIEFDITAASFTLPFAQNLSLGTFAMKGSATGQGMKIESWGGTIFDGALSGTANVRWGGTWELDGVLTARGINAAVFAPALLSAGRAEGTGKFSMSGAEPAKLADSGRLEGSFTVNKGVLGSFDLSRAIQSGGKQAGGRTQFAELNGQGTYDRGRVALRNIIIGAGALQAGASAEIAESGALSGRIVADVHTASQTLRATLSLAGTLKEPQVRN